MADVFASVKDVDCGSYELLSKPARAALDKLPVVGVDALDFGQGDCNAIVAKEGTDRRPVVLCDVGGGKGPTGGATHPWHDDWKITTAAPDVLLEPAIIQSHWDSDHYSTAVFAWRKLTLGDEERHVPTTKKLEALYDHCRWLVRRQRNGPSNTDFVRAVKSMVCWPEGLEGHSFQISPNTYVRVEPCTGENSAKSDRNLCGLAVRLVRTSKPDHTEDAKVTADIAEQAILPGDAPYKLFASAEAKWADAKVTILFAH
ncbi:MAG: hypothetical protein K8H88_33640, partial [Sandaracinaceae bacterium]|nr:hypothetical protein [Sandaracinaceae bacterium]